MTTGWKELSRMREGVSGHGEGSKELKEVKM